MPKLKNLSKYFLVPRNPVDCSKNHPCPCWRHLDLQSSGEGEMKIPWDSVGRGVFWFNSQKFWGRCDLVQQKPGGGVKGYLEIWGRGSKRTMSSTGVGDGGGQILEQSSLSLFIVFRLSCKKVLNHKGYDYRRSLIIGAYSYIISWLLNIFTSNVILLTSATMTCSSAAWDLFPFPLRFPLPVAGVSSTTAGVSTATSPSGNWKGRY